MIYLIGVSHAVQDYRWKQYAAIREEFKVYLCAIIESYKIVVLAEEYNEEALKKKNKNSVLKDIAESLSIPHFTHLYCDPDATERQRIGMPSDEEMEEEALKSQNRPYGSFNAAIFNGDKQFYALRHQLNNELKLIKKKYWPLREQFWFDKIKLYLDANILFIVGACHIRSFSDLIEHNGCKFLIIDEDWNKEKFPSEDC